MKAVILCGGRGTRLGSITEATPKCMLPVMGKPMIDLVISRIKKQGIKDITLALGYKGEAFLEKYGHMRCVIESEPLGTGGAIKNCIEGDDPVLVVNGDTVTPIDYNDMLSKHTHPLTIAVTPNGESAGTYIMNPDIFDDINKKSFSFENDVTPYTELSLYYIPWFTDFGTPEEYKKACKDWV